MKRLLGKIAAAFLVLMLVGATATRAQAPTFIVLHSFSGPDGANPRARLVVDAAGNLYGTTENGGAFSSCSGGCGTVFKLDSSGNETVLHNFPAYAGDGAEPQAGVIRDAAGNLYGTTVGGGVSSGAGTVFKLDPSGNETVLHSFLGNSVTEGFFPNAGLVMDTAGNLYGTTEAGGPSDLGTVYKVDTSGNESVLHVFPGYAGDGAGPQAGVIMDAAGNLYGTTAGGGMALAGNFQAGTVFKLEPTGNETVLHTFSIIGADGYNPYAGLVMDAAGNLYGTTPYGGSLTNPGAGFGAVFKLDASGNVTVLHSFTGSPDGAVPFADLIMDAAGNLYGTTFGGGSGTCSNFSPQGILVPGCGTVFKLDSSGNETVLHNFTGGDGANLRAGLVMDAAGNLYGTTYIGGGSGNCPGFVGGLLSVPPGCGIVFKLAPVSTVSNPPTITVSFPAAPSGQDGFFKAGQTPVVGSVSASDPSNVSAISCFDSLGGLTAGALAGAGTTSASQSLGVNGDGIHAIGCTATDGAGNSGAAPGSVNTATIDIDTTPPAIMFSGNQGTYTPDQTLSITTTATDALSGVATLSTQPLPNSSATCATGTRCVNFTATASSLGPGTHTISATATDGAGNAASASTSFTVLTPQQATQSIINSVNVLFSQGVINGGQDNSLVVQLQHAINLMNAGKNAGAIGNLDSFISEVNDLLSSGVLSPSQAASLISAAQGVIAAL